MSRAGRILIQMAINYQFNRIKVDASKYTKPSDEEIKKMPMPEQCTVTHKAATETAFSGEYFDNHRVGLYVDIVTGAPLYSLMDEYAYGCDWPSFTGPIDPDV